MAYFLAKTEPGTYSITQFQQDQTTTWDGVRNPQAVKAIRAMKTGDRVFIYHSGGESAIVGLAEITSGGRPDPNDPKSAVAGFRFLSLLDPPTTLAHVKQSGLFADFALVRQSRLSTMEAPAAFVHWMRQRYPQAGL
jgi:predicted RNA-binding protein with PUA-like domain